MTVGFSKTEMLRPFRRKIAIFIDTFTRGESCRISLSHFDTIYRDTQTNMVIGDDSFLSMPTRSKNFASINSEF